MNVFHKVTLQTMKRNRLRTIVTIVGVILSAAMVCAVTTSIASLRGYLQNATIYNSGDWYGSVYGADPAVADELRQDDRVSHLASVQRLGYATIDSENSDKPYLYLLGADSVFFEKMPVHVTQGRLPASENEVLLPEHLLSNGGVAVRLGDELTLNLGNRMAGGEALDQYNPYDASEILVPRVTRTYKVVGFYERPDFENYSAPGYSALTLPEPGGPQVYDLYYKTFRAAQAEALGEEHRLDYGINWKQMAYSGEFRYANVTQMFLGFAGVLIFLIALGSISLIYSAFSISVSQRTRQFGLLSSVGATRRQLHRSVLFEAAVVSAIGIPLGILSGIGGMAVTLYFLGDKFKSLYDSPVPMSVQVSWASVLAAAAIALLTVLISAWIPAKRAMRVSALEAIRQNQDIQSKGKDVRVSRLTRKLFGLEGLLAKKYFRRNRKRYRATVISLVLSLVLFISASSFCQYLTSSVDTSLSVADYDVACTLAPEALERLYPALREAEGVTEGIGMILENSAALTAEADLDASYLKYLRLQQEGSETLRTQMVPVNIFFLDEVAYRTFLTKQGLDPDQYLDRSNPVPVVYQQDQKTIYTQTESGEYERNVVRFQYLKKGTHTLTLRVPQTIEGYRYSVTDQRLQEDGTGHGRFGPPQDFFFPLDGEDSGEEQSLAVTPKTMELELGPVVSEAPLGVTDLQSGLALLYPIGAQVPWGEMEQRSSAVCFRSSDHAATAESLKTILMDQGSYEGQEQVVDIREAEESNRNIVTIVNVFSYGFIVLISLISAANVFNTISTNIALRRREFAMLRSVGMTRGGLNRMMNYECLLYGVRALLFGLPLSFLMTLYIYRVVGQSVTDTLQIPWNAVIIAVCSVFAVVFATMLYAMRRIKRENPIDAMKDENL